MTDRILPPLSADQKKIVRKEVMRFNHRLEQTGLFTDSALATLLDEHPRDEVTICTMQPNPPADVRWIAGEANGMSGEELVTAARTGALWVSPRSAMTRNPRYKVVFDQLMGEFSQATGLPVLTADAAVLISSPRMGIYFHVDPAETMLWHIRGHKTMHVYPPRQDIVTEAALEAILLKENLSDLPWSPTLEDHVLPVALKPGQAAFWPQHSPHRVVNGDDLNVSISVEFSSPQSMLTNAVFYTNGRMRRALGPEVARPDAGVLAGLSAGREGAEDLGAAGRQRRARAPASVRCRPVRAGLHSLARGHGAGLGGRRRTGQTRAQAGPSTHGRAQGRVTDRVPVAMGTP